MKNPSTLSLNKLNLLFSRRADRKMTRKIFIYYHRGDDARFAQALFAHLTQAFPPELLFMDDLRIGDATA
jgi:hypothetical protein